MAAPIENPTRQKQHIIYRVLELYSGIGGMHWALKESGLKFDVVQAIDVNTNANKIYKFNFPDTAVSARGIEGLTVKNLDNLNINIIMMSPPCQPFTRVGKKQDTNDARTRSFLHLLELIPKLKKCPSYILLENVLGFEVSETRSRLIEMLDKCRYVYQEMLLTPLQFGIPNSRLRYYLIAKKSPLDFKFERTTKIMKDLPEIATEWMTYKKLAESMQHHCVCGGYHRDKVKHDTDSKNSNISDRHGDSGKDGSSGTDRLGVSRDCEENINHKQRPISVSSTTDAQSGDIVIESEKLCHPVAIDNAIVTDISQSQIEDSQTHACAKRLKMDKTTEPDNSPCDSELQIRNDHLKEDSKVLDSGDSKTITTNDDCLEHFGLNMRQEQIKEDLLDPCLSLNHFLEDSKERDYFKPYCLSDDMLRRFVVMDIVNPCCRKSTCFTKGYGNFVNGAGSIFQMAKNIEVVEHASALKDIAVKNRDQEQWSESELNIIRSLQLRYFTPHEIANLLCFPKTFGFPSDLTNRQLYMLLGNSLNVHVVSVLVQLMVAGDNVSKVTEPTDS